MKAAAAAAAAPQQQQPVAVQVAAAATHAADPAVVAVGTQLPQQQPVPVQTKPREDAQTVYVGGVRYTKLECVGRGGSSKVFKVGVLSAYSREVQSCHVWCSSNYMLGQCCTQLTAPCCSHMSSLCCQQLVHS